MKIYIGYMYTLCTGRRLKSKYDDKFFVSYLAHIIVYTSWS